MTTLIASKEVLHEFQVCRRITTHYAWTLSLAARLLPFEKRMGICAVYTLYHRITSIVREADPRQIDVTRQHVQRIRDEVARVYADAPITDPTLRALRATVRRFDIPQQLLSDALRATELDFEKTRYRTIDEFSENQSALPLSEIVARVLGASSARAMARARDLGLALRLTEVLRSITADFAKGRILIPMEDMLKFGYTEESLGNQIVNERFRNLLSLQLERARKLYASGLEGIGAFDDDGSRRFVRVLSNIRLAELDAIESEKYDVFRGSRRISFPAIVRLAFKGLRGRGDAPWTPDPPSEAAQPAADVSRPPQSSVTIHHN